MRILIGQLGVARAALCHADATRDDSWRLRQCDGGGYVHRPPPLVGIVTSSGETLKLREPVLLTSIRRAGIAAAQHSWGASEEGAPRYSVRDSLCSDAVLRVSCGVSSRDIGTVRMRRVTSGAYKLPIPSTNTCSSGQSMRRVGCQRESARVTMCDA